MFLTPRGVCMLWQKDLLALHVTSDLLIALTCFAIPLLLVQLLRSRTIQEPVQGMLGWLAGCLFLCGLTHVMSVFEIWNPVYYESGLLKAITAGVALVALWRLARSVIYMLRVIDSGDYREILTALKTIRKGTPHA